MVKIVATVAAVGLLATGGIVSHNLYATAEKSPAKQVTAYSVTDSIEASRGNAREALSGDTSYVTVKINGKTRVVPGMHFTDVKSVLDAGDITLDTEDTVSPSLDTKVNENTVRYPLASGLPDVMDHGFLVDCLSKYLGVQAPVIPLEEN